MSSRAWFARASMVAASLASLTGCATFSDDAGFGRVDALVNERTGQSARWQRTPADEQAARARVAELLQSPLAADAAVEMALLNNPGLQAGFQELVVAESGLVEAGRLRNPVFSFGRMSGGAHSEIERAVLVNVLALFTMPLATEVQSRRFEQAQLRIAAEAVTLAADARRAYFSAVASQQMADYFEQVRIAADASVELARRMVQAGNASRLVHMREQAFYAEATAQLARARQRAHSDRERLTRVIGLQGSDGFRLPDRLPTLPATPAEPINAESTAMQRRLDVLAAKQSAGALARSLDLTRATGVINVLEVAYRNKSASHEPRENGYEIEIELPIFDFGTVRTARAEATYMQSVQRTAEVAIAARSQVREAYSAYRTSHDLARHYRDEVVPLRKRISEEHLLRYNGMLIGVFELLADARDQVRTVTASIEADRDFWLADIDLQMALTGGGKPGDAIASSTAPMLPASGPGH